MVRSVAATADEHARTLPGDALIADAVGQLTNAVTIQRPRRDVWPWLAQMGAGSRAGWYSYDRLDNAGTPSARRIIPSLQHVIVGTLFPALPGRTDGFIAVGVKPGEHLVLVWVGQDAAPLVTWAFVLEEDGPATTRLVVRARASRKYPFLGLPTFLGNPIIRVIHFVMQRRQLLGLAERVEGLDELLNQFIPDYDIIERYRVRVEATPQAAMAAARHIDLRDSALIRAIIKLRALAMGDKPDETERPRGLIAETTSMGWRVLAEDPGREVVVGAVTQPWVKDVMFRGLDPEEFAAFREPGYVKIAWTLRVDSVWPDATVFATETRAVATDDEARRKFRHYWRRVVPGTIAIRWLLLRLLKKEAEAIRLESLAHGRSH